ncbi:MAG TPA: cyclopropane-fatty-acyl-phospholipid synthase family protein [Streptosporangiaceae bacterium]
MTTATISRRPRAAAKGGWPVIPAARRGGLRPAIARGLLSWMAARLPIRIVMPDGTSSGSGGAGAPVLQLHDPGAFFARVGGGAAGFAESYMAGEWDSDDLPGLFTAFATHLPSLVPAPLRAFRRLYVPPRPAEQEATVDGARRNIEHHYDLSNAFFELFLDPTLTYSSALFAEGDTLEQAQLRKIDRLLDATGTGAGTRLLEIGTGWGELALRAAERGASVTSLTISPAQYEVATRRAAEAGLAGRIDVRLRDYREAEGRYDAVVSVEMIEAVGARYWPAYFGTIDRVLAPGGRAGIQAITMPHDQMLATMNGQTWIHQYIFPGGQIPSLRAMTNVLASHTDLRITSDLAMGDHYARTLSAWRARFSAADDDVEALGFSRPFQRMWDLYLAYSQAGFAAGYLDVHQLVLERP